MLNCDAAVICFKMNLNVLVFQNSGLSSKATVFLPSLPRDEEDTFLTVLDFLCSQLPWLGSCSHGGTSSSAQVAVTPFSHLLHPFFTDIFPLLLITVSILLPAFLQCQQAFWGSQTIQVHTNLSITVFQKRQLCTETLNNSSGN